MRKNKARVDWLEHLNDSILQIDMATYIQDNEKQTEAAVDTFISNVLWPELWDNQDDSYPAPQVH